MGCFFGCELDELDSVDFDFEVRSQVKFDFIDIFVLVEANHLHCEVLEFVVDLLFELLA